MGRVLAATPFTRGLLLGRLPMLGIRGLGTGVAPGMGVAGIGVEGFIGGFITPGSILGIRLTPKVTQVCQLHESYDWRLCQVGGQQELQLWG